MDETYPQNQTALRRPVRPVPQQQGEGRRRISWWMGWAMIITAISIDLFEALLNVLIIGEFLSPIISICADVLFWIWFMILGVSFSKNPKNLATMLIQALIGLMPGLDILPELTVGVFVLVKLTQSEDKGGIIGKMAHAAAPVMQNRAQYAGYNRQVENMERLGGSKSNIGGNNNTLDLKNKNTQNGQQSPNNKQQQGQGASKQPAGLDQEINSLKSNIGGWQSEIQRLEQQLSEKESRLREHERSNSEMIKVLQESGRADEARARELEEHGRQATMPLFSETVSLHNRIKWLKDSIWSGNNKLIELERKAGAAKMEAARSGS